MIKIITKFFRLFASIPHSSLGIQCGLFAFILACAILAEMTSLTALLPYILIAISVLIVIAILIQKSEAGVGGSFGGNDNFSAGFHTRRGFEKKLFYFTIALGVLLAVFSLLILVIR